MKFNISIELKHIDISILENQYVSVQFHNEMEEIFEYEETKNEEYNGKYIEVSYAEYEPDSNKMSMNIRITDDENYNSLLEYFENSIKTDYKICAAFITKPINNDNYHSKLMSSTIRLFPINKKDIYEGMYQAEIKYLQ